MASSTPQFASPATDAARALSLQDVTFGYEAGAAVVSDVTASLAPGKLCCLIGPNAAGKSTLLKLMLGHLEPWSGEVALHGQSIPALSPRQRACRISYVPQRGQVSFAYTVEQVVEMGRFASGPDASAVRAAMAQCDLLELRGRTYAHLSGGQQQRVLIARAMAQSQGEGRLMLLDEPGSSLDLWHVHQLMRLLRLQAERGLAVLVVLHDLNLAARYADEVWLMDEGRLVAAGPWQDVLQPNVLEPVYRVGLEPLTAEAGARPVFRVEPRDTL